MIEFVKNAVEIIIHFDKHLNLIIQSFGIWSYGFLFLIIFAETGLVVTPFLPGDSLLFAVGAFAALGSFNVLWLSLILAVAAILGDSVNYMVGNLIGEKMLGKGDGRFFKKEHVERTHRFFEKYGGKTIILARFVPIIRTFAPFVAGLGKMTYRRFFIYNVVGGFLWVSIFVFGGYYFGNIPIIRNNFFVVTLIIIFLSILPAGIEIIKHRKAKNNEK